MERVEKSQLVGMQEVARRLGRSSANAVSEALRRGSIALPVIQRTPSSPKYVLESDLEAYIAEERKKAIDRQAAE